MDAVLPLEETDPELAKHILAIVNKQHRVRGFNATWRRREYYMWDDDTMVCTTKPPGRNDPCGCGSKLKYKKCCGR